jgi:O-antigen/teichoic acid export membrane protein
MRLINPPVSVLWVSACWGAFILATGYSLGTSHWMLACQGINRVRELQGSFFWSGLSFVASALVMLLLGAGLETMVVATAIRAMVGRQFCYHAYRKALPEEKSQKPPVDLLMLKRLWPNARKFSVLSLGAYLVSNGTTLICSQILGAEATASFGLTVQIGNFIAAFSALWLTVKWPQITVLRAQGKLQEMGIVFARRLMSVMVTFILLSVLLILTGNSLLEWKGTRTRLLSTPLLAVFMAYLAQQQFYVQFGTLTFTENVVPFFKISIFTGIGLLGLSWIMAPTYGLWGLVIAPLIATLACSSWYVVYRGFRGQPLSLRQFVQAALFGHL